MAEIDDNLTRQADEIEALSSIYGSAFKIEDEANRSYSILIGDPPNVASLFFKFSEGYPASEPPSYQLSAPWLKGAERSSICQNLESLYLDYVGDTVVFQWAEKLREILQDRSSDNRKAEDEDSNDTSKLETCSMVETLSCPSVVPVEFVHGEVIVDRKSSFQGHVAVVRNAADARRALESLLSNRKIAAATHNIYAYRIERSGCYLQDCEDDGETQAGSRLLHLLQVLDVRDVLVVVSRWYGGILLGPDRFRHISNAARQVLQQAELLK